MSAVPKPLEFPFHISFLEEEDIPAVMEIERASFSLPWSAGIYRYELRDNPYAFYLCVRTTEQNLPSIAAYGGIWLYLPEAHVSTIAVHPRLRGLHLGAWLLAAMLVRAAREGAEEATLEVRVSNYVAQRLYRTFGFRVVGRRPRYYSDNKEDAYIMSLSPLDRLALVRRLKQEREEVSHRWATRQHHAGSRSSPRTPPCSRTSSRISSTACSKSSSASSGDR